MIAKDGSEGYKFVLEGVSLKNLTHGDKTHLTKVMLDKGAIIPEHKHPNEQTGYLLSGKLKFFSGDQDFIVLPGDSWTFLGDTMHGAEALEDTIVLECFSPAREDYLKL
ncbi:cupin domain-containing protein [Bacteroidota bacterium]